ncbi:MAG: serine/threonine-protein phosphatase [Lachnospiraceae bacterium]|nr:serine/threonine-protein phosphatase [Lachnospiraceae bacterium]
MERMQRRELMGGSLVFGLMVLTTAGGIFLRGTASLPGIYVLNLGMDLLGMVAGYVLFVSCIIDVQKNPRDMRIFMLILFMTVLSMFTDAAAWLLDGIPSLRLLNILDNTLYYMCSPLQALLFWIYIQRFIRLTRPSALFLDRAVKRGLVIPFLMRFVNLFTGIYFTVDKAGIYHRSSVYFISMFYVYFTLFSALVVIFQERRHLRTYQLVVMVSYVAAPLIMILATLPIYGLSVSPPMMICEVLLMYCVLNVDQGRQQVLAERDMQMAARIQTSMLPGVFPAFPDRKDFDIFASMTPARDVGGDFYDFFLIDDDHLAMVIADVSGKGVPAALFMMASMILVHNTAEMGGTGMSPGRVLARVNDAICSNNAEEMFVTAWLGILTISTGRVTAASAGHEYPILKKAGGEFELMKDPHGLVIGAMEGIRYRDYEFTLEKGGALFVYTDGVPEAADEENRLFGTERTLQALNGAPQGSPEELLVHVKEAVERFAGGAPQFDDLTMLAVTRK